MGDLSTGRRRSLGVGVALFAAGTLAGVGGALMWARESRMFRRYLRQRSEAELGALVAEVVPSAGVELPVRFGDVVRRLVAVGAISPARFERLYASRGGVPEWMRSLFEQPSEEPIRISAISAPLLLNLLWPLGVYQPYRFQ